jgi:hypothetical protein
MASTFRRSRMRWVKGDAFHEESKREGWAMILRLAEKHELSVESCLDYMVTPGQASIITARFLDDPPKNLTTLGRERGVTLEAIESMELRGLWRLLTRLLRYDTRLSGRPPELVVYTEKRREGRTQR